MTTEGGARIAVIIPARNAGATIDAALGSVAGQTRPVDHVLVVDDASTDDTADRAHRWRSMLPIEVITHSEAVGPGLARNVGIGHTTLELLSFLDADDVWLPNHLEVLCELGPAPGVAACGRLVNWVPEAGLLPRSEPRWPGAGDQRQRLLHHNFVPIATVVARSDVLEVGGFRSHVTEDWDLWIRLSRVGVVFRQAHVPTVLYRRSSTSRSVHGREIAENIATLESAVAGLAEGRELHEGLRSLRAERSRLEFLRAYELASGGDPVAARLAAIRVCRDGRFGIRWRALAIAVAPRLVSRTRQRARARPGATLRE